MTNFAIQGLTPNYIQSIEHRAQSIENNNSGINFNQVVAQMNRGEYVPHIFAGEQKSELEFLKREEKAQVSEIKEDNPEELISGIKKILEELCKK